eukprot:GHVU01144719.1.p3 GENE.GHVU01144719.1~~GHVU01144719.1.p3  ORF type:complete len:155 (-),score=14.61 GHVU01144719.1:802-1266(-)
MGASPQFYMGAQMLLFANYLCDPLFRDQETDSKRVDQPFKIDGYEVIGKSIYKFYHNAPEVTAENGLFTPRSFVSFIRDPKFSDIKVKANDYTRLRLGQTTSNVDRWWDFEAQAEPPQPEEGWYTTLKASFGEWTPRQDMHNFDELWDIDAKFR